jgi:hypothetical protein
VLVREPDRHGSLVYSDHVGKDGVTAIRFLLPISRRRRSPIEMVAHLNNVLLDGQWLVRSTGYQDSTILNSEKRLEERSGHDWTVIAQEWICDLPD